MGLQHSSRSYAESAAQTEYRISARWRVRDPIKHVHAGVVRATEFFAKRPHDKIMFQPVAQTMVMSHQTA